MKVKRMFDRQSKFATLRGMMYAKGMYRVEEDGSVVVDVNANSKGVVVVPPASGGSGGSGGSGADDGGLSPV